MVLSWQEKRRAERISCSESVQYQIRGTNKSYSALTCDISSSGVGFLDSNFIPLNSVVMLEVKVGGRFLKSVARVARSSAIPRSNRFHLGAEFLELDLKEKDYLEKYISLRKG